MGGICHAYFGFWFMFMFSGLLFCHKSWFLFSHVVPLSSWDPAECMCHVLICCLVHVSCSHWLLSCHVVLSSVCSLVGLCHVTLIV